MSREDIKHTQGPWNYDRSGYSLYVNSGRELVTALSMDGKRLETSEANARLIAAAPDMLDALQRAREVLLWNLGDDARIDAAFDAVTAAINKATYTQGITA